jgi:hypothetical protein
MATLTPQPIPVSGARKLSSKEIIQRAKAVNCTLASKGKPSCTGQVNIGIFFDGTGNNKEIDFDTRQPLVRKHSNVVKLFNAFPDRPEDGYISHYIPGVGTPFPQIGDSGKNVAAGAFAWNGETRVTWAFTRILNAAQRYVLNTDLMDDVTSARIANNMASSLNPPFMRRAVLRTWQKKLASNLKGQLPRVELINLSVFGFSRGAAEARVFCNWLLEVCEPVGGGWEFAGIPIRLNFLGIFDTVASVGIPDTFLMQIVEGHQSWADNNLQIHPAIEQCVHFVAGHEVRAAFPLDSVRMNGIYPGNAKEVMYPGAHSDLGGGYPPNAVGIAQQTASEMARIPGAQMYKEALLAGVCLLKWSNLPGEYQADLTVAPRTAADFNAYLTAIKIAPGPVEEVHQKHMSLYLSYRYKYRNAIVSLPFYQRASARDKGFIKITTDTFNKRLSHLSSYPVLPSDSNFVFADAVAQHQKFTKAAGLAGSNSPQLQQLYTMVDYIRPQDLTPVIEDFLGNYVHDSMAGFIDMGGWKTNEFFLNQVGIFKFRKIFKGND